jgi:hypothetical protein
MKFLNPNRCFVIPPKTPAPTIHINESENWLDRLVEICGGSLSAPEKLELTEHINRHAGEASTYATKVLLVDGLKHLLYHLSNTENPMSASQKEAISYKLIEGAKNCTPGFHNRVNEILSGFYLSETLDSLLLQIRQNIVLSTASKATNEVHAHNRFYVVAQILGYGVEPMNSQDVYRGNIPDTDIENQLNTAFEDNFTITNILNELIDGMKGVLLSQYEYTGEKSDGYPIGQYDNFISYLRKVLSPTEVNHVDFLVMDDDEKIVDVNWNKIKQSLLKVLLEKEYFQLDEDTETCLQKLVEKLGEKNHEPIDVTSFFVKKGLIDNPKQLISLLFFLDTANQDTQLKLIQTFIDNIPPTTPVGYREIATWAVQKEIFKEVFKALLKKDHAIMISFMHGIKNQPAVLARFLSFFDELAPEEQIKLLTQTDGKQNNALMLAAIYQPDLVAPLLTCIERLAPEEQIKLLTQTDGKQNNALVLAARYQPDVVAPLLASLEKIAENQPSFFNELTEYLTKNLRKIILNNPGALNPFLSSLEKLAPKQLSQILTKTDKDGNNFLSYEYHIALAPLLASVANLIKIQPNFVNENEDFCFEALWRAIQLYPSAVEPLLAILEKKAPSELAKILTKTDWRGNIIFSNLERQQHNVLTPLLASVANLIKIQPNFVNENQDFCFEALRQAIQFAPDSVAPLLASLKTIAKNQPSFFNNTEYLTMTLWSLIKNWRDSSVAPLLESLEEIAPTQLANILTVVDSKGKNALIIASQQNLTALTPLLSSVTKLINNQPNFVNENQDYCFEALRQAIQFAPDSVAPLLASLEEIAPTELANFLKEIDRKGNNALIIAARQNPTIIVPLLASLEKTTQNQPNFFNERTEYLSMTLRRIIQYPEALKLFLSSLEKIAPQELAKILPGNDRNGYNFLSIIEQENICALAPLLASIENLINNQPNFVKENQDFCFEALRQAIQHYPPAVAPLLESLEKIAPQKLSEMFINSLHENTELAWVVRWHPLAVAPLLASLEKIAPPINLAKILTTIVSGNDINALKPTAIVPLLASLEKIAPDKLSALLTQNISEVDKVLLSAIKNEITILETYLKIIEKLPTPVQNRILTQTLTGGQSALMLALDKPDALRVFLQTIEKLPPSVQISILTQTPTRGQSALMLALNKPDALKEILQTIGKLAPEDQAKLLIPSNQSGRNALGLVLNKEEARDVFLQAIGELSPEIQVKLFSDTNSNGDNVFRELLQRTRDETLFNSIDKLPPDNLIKLMTHKNHQGRNVLSFLAEYERDTCELFLKKIQSLALPDISIETKHKYCSLLKKFKRKVAPNSEELKNKTDEIHETIKRDIATRNYKSQIIRFNLPDRSDNFDQINSSQIENITPTLWIHFLHKISRFFSALSERLTERFSMSTNNSGPVQPSH